MFIETLQKDHQHGYAIIETQSQNRGKADKNFWDTCGVLFVNTNDNGEITSISVKHNMYPGVDMMAFPKRDSDGEE